MDKRTKKRYNALTLADNALYELWKQSEVNSPEMAAINHLQKNYIHPALRAIRKEAEQRTGGKK